MKALVWIVVILFVFLIQGSVSIYHITPNLTVLLAYYAGLKLKEVKGLFVGAGIGLLEDSLGGILLGSSLLSKGLTGYFASFMYKRFFIWTPALGIMSVFVFTFIDGLIVYITRSIFATTPFAVGTAFLIILIQALLNAPLGIFLKPKNGRKNLEKKI